MTPTEAAIAVVGSLNLDLVVRVPRLPGPGETVSGDDVFRNPGGKGANQAVAAARLARLAAGAAFCGGLADALAAGATLEDAARRAVRVAAAACLRQGAQASLPTRRPPGPARTVRP